MRFYLFGGFGPILHNSFRCSFSTLIQCDVYTREIFKCLFFGDKKGKKPKNLGDGDGSHLKKLELLRQQLEGLEKGGT